MPFKSHAAYLAYQRSYYQRRKRQGQGLNSAGIFNPGTREGLNKKPRSSVQSVSKKQGVTSSLTLPIPSVSQTKQVIPATGSSTYPGVIGALVQVLEGLGKACSSTVPAPASRAHTPTGSSPKASDPVSRPASGSAEQVEGVPVGCPSDRLDSEAGHWSPFEPLGNGVVARHFIPKKRPA